MQLALILAFVTGPAEVTTPRLLEPDDPLPTVHGGFAAPLAWLALWRGDAWVCWDAPGLSLRLVATGAPAALAAENARGLAICVELGGLRLLAPGDLPAAQAAAAAADCGVVDVLWAAHHGGADGSSTEVIAAADPALIVITAGRDNAYCHPAPITLARLAEREVWISGLAGAGPLGGCAGLATSFGARHRLLPGDLWLAAGD